VKVARGGRGSESPSDSAVPARANEKESVRRVAVVVSLLALFAFVLVACRSSGANATAVEAPVVSVDASSSAIALVRDQPADISPLDERPGEGAPFRVGERWVGQYNCLQGKTELVLIFEEVGGAPSANSIPVAAIFEFHYDGANLSQGFAASDGAARMRGHFDPKSRRLVLNGEDWIDQPPNYRLINLVGIINKNGTYSGTVDGPGCTTFSAAPEKNSGSAPILPPRSLPRPRP
jgi:hypothetical protein